MSERDSDEGVPGWLVLVFLALVVGTLLGTIAAVSGTNAALLAG